MQRIIRPLLLTGWVTLALLLTACSDDDDSSSSTTSRAIDGSGAHDERDRSAVDPTAEEYCDTLRELLTLDMASEADRPRVRELLVDLSSTAEPELAAHIDHLLEVADEVGVDRARFDELLAEDPALPAALVAIQTFSIESCDADEVLPD